MPHRKIALKSDVHFGFKIGSNGRWVRRSPLNAVTVEPRLPLYTRKQAQPGHSRMAVLCQKRRLYGRGK